MKSPKVAIIICTYNMGHYIKEAIDSVLKSRYTNFHIIVVDDGSEDNTQKTVEQNYGSSVTYIKQTNQGLFAARNAGIHAATDADYYSIVDADDLIHPLKVWDEVAFLEKNPNCSICFSNMLSFIDGENNGIVMWDNHKVLDDSEHEFKLSGLIEKISLYRAFTSVSTIRARDMLKIGGYDRELKCAGDLDLAIRISRLGGAGFIPQIRYFRRCSAQTMTVSMRDRIVHISKIFDKVGLSDGKYSSDEIAYLLAMHKGFLFGSLWGVGLGLVDSKYKEDICRRLISSSNLLERLKILIFLFMINTGLSKIISKVKNYRKVKITNSVNYLNIDDCMNDMTACFPGAFE